jgi:hypothetical protein
MENEIKREESESHQLITNKDSEIEELKGNLNRILADYDDLLSSKTDLEMEIRTYRKLLEGEDERFEK